ncbi:ComEC/Rec2 family competence protein [Sphingomonas abietis]|uniref:ComEC/Rec2 family competence protein n=1 Tax=Sphingomonas abietis TaxID=3012344 RepID=A0ABY7NSV8_9SPHN|nr:ComEC/Rec2 family competence protein [Sphingomonas abietis]WBO23662.1 ComEC/Rec2 family competence protein [Sphingomonas abietis]
MTRQTGAGAPGSPRVAGAPARLAARFSARLEKWLEAERTQLPLWLPVGGVAGVAAWFWLPAPAAWQGFLLLAAALALPGLVFGRGGRIGRAVALFALAAAIGCGLIWWKAARADGAALPHAVVAAFTARIDRVEPLPARASVRLTLHPLMVAPDPRGGAIALPGRIRLTVPLEDAVAGLAPGATLAARARLVPPPSAAVPGAYDYAAVAWFAGIGATGKALAPVRLIAPAPAGGPSLWLADARIALTAHILSELPPGEGGVAAALATGDMGAVTQDDNNAFRNSGLAHLLSVSGLHLTAAVGATMVLALRLLALWPRLALRAPLLLIAAGCGGVVGIAYTLLTGAEVPTVRSLVAALVVLAGIALGREAMTLRLVATGALVCVLFWPESVAGPSFQLSFAAILSIVALHELPWTRRMFEKREEGHVRRLLREVAALLLTGLVVEAALAPIAIFHFHRAGLYGAAANIVAIPLTTFVIMPAEALALLFDSVGLGAAFWWVTGRALALLLAIAHHVGSLPGAVTFVPTMSRLAFASIMAGGLWLALWRTRARLFGLLPVAIGLVMTLAAHPADIFVTGDGRHLAVRAPDGQVALLRQRTGDYMRDTLSELSGREGDEAIALDDLPGARCGPDSCAATLVRGDRIWHLLATRSPYRIDRPAMEQACAAADIVASDRRLPGWCRPRWLKADAALLAGTGGLAISLVRPAVVTVAAMQGQHPWALHAAARPAGAIHGSYRRFSQADEARHHSRNRWRD